MHSTSCAVYELCILRAVRSMSCAVYELCILRAVRSTSCAVYELCGLRAVHSTSCAVYELCCLRAVRSMSCAVYKLCGLGAVQVSQMGEEAVSVPLYSEASVSQQERGELLWVNESQTENKLRVHGRLLEKKLKCYSLAIQKVTIRLTKLKNKTEKERRRKRDISGTSRQCFLECKIYHGTLFHSFLILTFWSLLWIMTKTKPRV